MGEDGLERGKSSADSYQKALSKDDREAMTEQRGSVHSSGGYLVNPEIVWHLPPRDPYRLYTLVPSKYCSVCDVMDEIIRGGACRGSCHVCCIDGALIPCKIPF